MAKEIATGQKSLTIQRVNITDIVKFHDDRKGKSPAEYFAQILHQKNEVNFEETESLHQKLTELTEKNAFLVGENKDLFNKNQELHTEIETLQLEKAKILAVTDELTAEIEDYKANPKTIEKAIELTGNEFICNPSDEATKIARRYRSFLRKDGIITGPEEEYASELFSIAIPKYLKNRYE